MSSAAEYILKQFNNEKIPIIIKYIEGCKKLPLEKEKYIIRRNMTLSEFHYVLNKKIKITKQQSIVLFINNTLQLNSSTMGSLYNEYKDTDDILYITLRCENTFG